MLQVVDLHVFAHPRITLKPLVPAFPCFANINVSLMEKVGDFEFLAPQPKQFYWEWLIHLSVDKGK